MFYIVAISMMSEKLATLDLFKIKVFWNKGYDGKIFVIGVTNKVLLRDSIYFVDVVMRQKFGNFSISKRKVIITTILYRFDQKKQLFNRCA